MNYNMFYKKKDKEKKKLPSDVKKNLLLYFGTLGLMCLFGALTAIIFIKTGIWS